MIRLTTTFLEKLARALSGPLPGEQAHLKMASQVRKQSVSFGHDPASAIKSGVLIHLFPRNEKLHTVVMLGQTYNGVHSGQVSFPGGRAEEGDRDLIATALREAHEDVNIDPDKVTVLGHLSELYLPPSNFLVTPVIGYSLSPPDLKPDHTEVAEIIDSSLDFLFDPSCTGHTLLHVRGTAIDAPYFLVGDKTIWGATAMILSELKEIIRSINLNE